MIRTINIQLTVDVQTEDSDLDPRFVDAIVPDIEQHLNESLKTYGMSCLFSCSLANETIDFI